MVSDILQLISIVWGFCGDRLCFVVHGYTARNACPGSCVHDNQELVGAVALIMLKCFGSTVRTWPDLAPIPGGFESTHSHQPCLR